MLQVHRDEGETFAAGDVLAALDCEDPRLQLEARAASLRDADARLQRLRGTTRSLAGVALEQARMEEERTAREVERAQALVDRGLATSQSLDAARDAQRAATLATRRSEAELRALGREGVDVLAALAQVDLARTEHARAELRVDACSVRAPMAGRVLGRHVEPGVMVAAGQALLTLAPDEGIEIRLQPDERELAALETSLTERTLSSQAHVLVEGRRTEPAPQRPRGPDELVVTRRSPGDPRPPRLPEARGLLALEVGDTFRLAGPEGTEATARVAGLAAFGVAAADDAWVFTSPRRAQVLLGRVDEITRVDIQVDEPSRATDVAARLRAELDADVSSWQERNPDLLAGIRAQGSSGTVINLFVALAVALGIASVLAVSVVQRRGEIGVLRATGTPARAVWIIFLWQGAIVGLVGSLFGSALGVGLLHLFLRFVRDENGDPLFPVVVSWQQVAVACLLACITGLVAAVVPARAAARMDPVSAIRDK